MSMPSDVSLLPHEVKPDQTASGGANVNKRISALEMLCLATWCGMTAGLLEVMAMVVRKRFFDAKFLLDASRHFIWIVPLIDLLILSLVGASIALLIAFRPAAGGKWAMRALVTLTLLPFLLTALPQVFGLAVVVLAIGLSIRLATWILAHSTTFRRVVIISSPLFAVLLAALALVPWWSDRMERPATLAGPPPPGSPSVLLIVMDTVAAEHLALYGYPRSTSPTLDELAKRGCRFQRAVSTSSWTLPSHSSMFTGRFPHELSVGWKTPLDRAEPTIAEFLRAKGYDTAGFIANTSYCSRNSGLARGFTTYNDHIFVELSPLKLAILVEKVLDLSAATAETICDALDLQWPMAMVRLIRDRFEGDRKEGLVVNQEFLDWLSHRADPDRPFFAFLNYVDAHSPYSLGPRRMHRFGVKPTENHEYRLIRDWWTIDKSKLSAADLEFVRNAYDDCVAALDEQIGVLMDRLATHRRFANMWVIIVSDHGESFAEHPGVYLHGTSLYQTELHVPLVVVPPVGVTVKPIVKQTISLRDMATTIADITGQSAGAPFPGRSLARLLNPPAAGDPGGENALAEVVPNESLLPPRPDPSAPIWPLGGVVEPGWSYIRREGDVVEELYHLSDDPNEQRNLAPLPGSQPELDRLRAGLSRLTGGPLTPARFKP
jgi:arylsulfatase A-like enzyme